MVWPLRSTPITGASALLRASPPTHPASVLNTSQFLLLGGLPLTTPTGAAVSGRAFPRSMQPQQTRLASPSCRTPPGQSAGTRQAHPGNNLKPRFRCHVVNHLDTSTAIHLRSPSWSPPDASPAPSPHRSPPRPHDQGSMRRFEASPRRATPKGQTFISCTAPPSPTITHSSRPPTLVAHQVLIIAPPLIPRPSVFSADNFVSGCQTDDNSVRRCHLRRVPTSLLQCRFSPDLSRLRAADLRCDKLVRSRCRH